MNPIKVLIADDQLLFIEGLSAMLGAEEGIQIAGTACNGHEALLQMENELPDVVVTDIQMPQLNGIALTRAVKARYPGLPVIGLTMFGEDHLILDMMKAGARGYLQKAIPKNDLLDAIKTVLSGGFYFCNNSSHKLLRRLAGTDIQPFECEEDITFTSTEIAILRLICKGYSTKEIAKEMNMSIKTIEGYRSRLLEKTGARNTAGLVFLAARKWLV